MKTRAGRFFEDFIPGETIHHATPRSLGDGERALYHALYPARHAIHSSEAFARASGLTAAPLDELIVFHVVFGRSVPDISLNAVANLGYAECRWLKPVYPGATLSAFSEVIGRRETSGGTAGVVWVRTTGQDETGEPVLSFIRWVLVRKLDEASPAPDPVVPVTAASVAAQDLRVPTGLTFAAFDASLSGEPWRAGDYAPGEIIDHRDRVTLSEAEHMMATRVWQNTARVHFDATAREDGRRLIYGGHIMSMARALSFNGLANAQMLVGINAGAHANPAFAGDTVTAWSEVREVVSTSVEGVAAIRLRTVACKAGEVAPGALMAEGRYLPGVLLDLDYWALLPA